MGIKESAVRAVVSVDGDGGSSTRIADRDIHWIGGVIDDRKNSVELNRHRRSKDDRVIIERRIQILIHRVERVPKVARLTESPPDRCRCSE